MTKDTEQMLFQYMDANHGVMLLQDDMNSVESILCADDAKLLQRCLEFIKQCDATPFQYRAGKELLPDLEKRVEETKFYNQ